MPSVLKCGSLNLLEPSGPVQACNGIALPFLPLIYSFIHSFTTDAKFAYCVSFSGTGRQNTQNLGPYVLEARGSRIYEGESLINPAADTMLGIVP